MPTTSSRATSKANAKANDTLTARHSAQMKITASLEKKQDSTDQSIQISTNTSTKKTISGTRYRNSSSPEWSINSS